jgi:hypothetical protein
VLHAVTRIAAAIGVVIGANARAQELPAKGSVPHRAPPIFATLKAEATKVGTSSVSPLFAAIADPNISRDLLLSSEQKELVRRLHELTRDVIKAWLLRGLDSDPAPAPAVLVERLAESGDRLRDRLVAQADAIVYECVLNPAQARILRKATGQKAPALLAGRNGPPFIGASDEHRSSVELAENLRNLPDLISNFGPISLALLGKPGMRDAYPHGISHLDPVRQALARRDMPKVDLAPGQIDLVQRLDKLILAIWSAWLLRDLDKTSLPPQPLLAQRLWEGGERLRGSLFSRAEAIALLGIVTPEQADRALIAVWEQYGMAALADPTLESRLGLRRSQREEMLFLLESKKDVSSHLSEVVQPFWHLRLTDPEARAQADQLENEADGRKQEIDELILTEVLTPSQARALMRILGGTGQPAQRPAAKVKKSSRPG